MCSSPKGSSQCFRQTKRIEFNRSEYEEHASMMRRASAIYDRIEQEKSEKKLFAASQQVAPDNKKEDLDNQVKIQIGLISGIKAFFLQAVF